MNFYNFKVYNKKKKKQIIKLKKKKSLLKLKKTKMNKISI